MALICVEDDGLVELGDGVTFFVETSEILDQRVCVFRAVLVDTFCQGKVSP